MTYANAHKTLSIRQWIGLIASLVAFLGVVTTVRVVADHQAEQPIEEPYRLFLQHLADNSTDAEATLSDYRERHERDTVPSKHFAAVCVVMVRDAKAQGIRPEAYSEQMTRGCLQMGRDITEVP
jgi:hypothetical protein